MRRKNNKLILILLSVAAVVLAVVVSQTCSATRLFYIEEKSGGSIQASYLYLDEERTYTFEVAKKKYGCVEVETNGGSFYVEVIDAYGKYIVDDCAMDDWIYTFDSETDITVNLKFVEHSGAFRIFFSDEPIY